MKNLTLKALVITLSIGVLSACSTTGNQAGGAGVTDGTVGKDGVVTAGVGQDGSFVGDKAGALEVGNQTYYFDFDKSEVRASDRDSINVQARYLAAHEKAKVLLEGNTDPRGSREYNIALGERRANAVADLLKLQGVDSSQIRVVSYGAEKLASLGHSDEDYQKDRRVELSYEEK